MLKPTTNKHNESQDDGRRWARYPVDGAPIMVIAGKLEFEAVVVDESIGGIGIETRVSVAVMEGQVIDLSYHGAQLRGQVSSISPTPDGGCRISVSWEEKESLPQDSDQVAFLEVGPLNVVCKTQSNCSDQQHIITLWDGKQFAVSADQLTFRTRKARLVELQMTGEERDMTARLYGLDTKGSPHAVTKRIIEFEFGNR